MAIVRKTSLPEAPRRILNEPDSPSRIKVSDLDRSAGTVENLAVGRYIEEPILTRKSLCFRNTPACRRRIKAESPQRMA
jgi:hypothetical protein